MGNQEDNAFNQRVYEATLSVTERYVEESGRPGRTRVAPFDPESAVLDYTRSYLPAMPVPYVSERVGLLIVSKVMKIPKKVFQGVIVPAFDERAEEIIAARQEHPMVQLADHMPNQLPVATQFAGNLALAKTLTGGTRDARFRELIRRSHGIGTVGYRALDVRPVPHLPFVPICNLARLETNTHYSVPLTDQYKNLPLLRPDRKRLNSTMGANLAAFLLELPEPVQAGRGVNPRNLRAECVMNPVGTKQLEQDGKIIIPAAQAPTGMLIDGFNAATLEVFTAFELDKDGTIVDGHCEVGPVGLPSSERSGNEVIQNYQTRLAEFRTQHEGREVIYAGAA